MMKKIIRRIFLAGIVPLSLGVGNAALANPYAPIINKANHLRTSAWCLNDQARALELTAKHLPVHSRQRHQLMYQAKKLRQQATRQARQSNRVAKRAFDNGYIRPDRRYS